MRPWKVILTYKCLNDRMTGPRCLDRKYDRYSQDGPCGLPSHAPCNGSDHTDPSSAREGLVFGWPCHTLLQDERRCGRHADSGDAMAKRKSSRIDVVESKPPRQGPRLSHITGHSSNSSPKFYSSSSKTAVKLMGLDLKALHCPISLRLLVLLLHLPASLRMRTSETKTSKIRAQQLDQPRFLVSVMDERE